MIPYRSKSGEVYRPPLWIILFGAKHRCNSANKDLVGNAESTDTTS